MARKDFAGAHILNVGGPKQSDFTPLEQAVMLIYFLAEKGWPPWAKGRDGDLKVVMMATLMKEQVLRETLQSLTTKGMIDCETRERFA